MTGTIRARVKGGMLEPLETLNLPEGKEVTVTILDVRLRATWTPFAALQGDGKGRLTRRSLSRISMPTASFLRGPSLTYDDPLSRRH
jgi:hypothetical protein